MDGNVRLQDGTDKSNGRVEICQNGTWGSVCNNTWDHTDASVLCTQLGYGNEGTTYTANSELRNLKVTYSLPLRCGSHWCFWPWRICVSE